MRSKSSAFYSPSTKILFAFAADAVLNAELPSVLAETASQEFSAQVQQFEPLLYEKINDPENLCPIIFFAAKTVEKGLKISEKRLRFYAEKKKTNAYAVWEIVYIVSTSSFAKG